MGDDGDEPLPPHATAKRIMAPQAAAPTIRGKPVRCGRSSLAFFIGLPPHGRPAAAFPGCRRGRRMNAYARPIAPQVRVDLLPVAFSRDANSPGFARPAGTRQSGWPVSAAYREATALAKRPRRLSPRLEKRTRARRC